MVGRKAVVPKDDKSDNTGELPLVPISQVAMEDTGPHNAPEEDYGRSGRLRHLRPDTLRE